MAHHTYRTEALILKTLPRGDSDMFVQMYTRDFGYIGGIGAGLRKGQSKLRYALQEYSRAQVTLVHGKTGWRITGATSIQNYFYETEEQMLVARLFSVIKLLAGSEEENERVFAAAVGMLDALKEGGDRDALEILGMVRILHALGYIDGEKAEKYINTNAWDSGLLGDVSENKTQLTAVINQGIEASQL